MLEYYKELLGYKELPIFIKKYLKSDSLKRLNKISYFCGMDYASKDIYNFKEYITRYDHSLTVALLTYKLTNDKTSSLAGLFHDVATPCFSHVIDYMNNDYANQETTEEYTEEIIMNDKYLLECLKEDNIKPEDIINFKKYTIVDNDRPKLCADRMDGIILTGISWTKNITKKDIKEIVSNLTIQKNEYGEKEIAFTNEEIAKRVININETIDAYCHSDEDNYMMTLLAKITKLAIDNKYISYDDLFTYNEEVLFKTLESITDKEIKTLLNKFKTIKREEIEVTILPNLKKRNIRPLLNGKRI